MNNLIPIKFKNKNVITTELLAKVYGTDVKNISKNFSRNVDKFKKDKHYYLLEGDELRRYKHDSPERRIAPNVNKLYLWTERGANRHCKILDTDKAWEQFDNLEETYFKVKENLQQQLPANYIEALESLVESEKEKEQLKLESKQKDKEIEVLKPLATYTETILQSKSLVPVTSIAKDYGMSAITFNRLLYFYKIQYKKANQWFLYAKYQDKGYVHSKTFSFKRTNGTPDVSPQTEWTQRGRLFLYDFLKDRGIVPVIEQDQQQITMSN